MNKTEKNKFYCLGCTSSFETEGKKIEYLNPIYGPRWKWVAICPVCGVECTEYLQKSSSSKTNTDFDSLVNDLRKKGGDGCCGGGSCCG